MTDQYMLMFSLGPVQPFIAQARKTRDLWLGSLLIAKLMEAGMRDIPGDFVFPFNKTVDDVPDIPNKYIALYATETEAEDAVTKSIQQIRAFWEEIAEKVWTQIIGKTGDEITRGIWDRQTKFTDLFEIFWVIQSSKGTQDDYSKWLKKTEELFAARKRLRDFTPQNEPGEKSVMSGVREVLRNKDGVKAFWESIASKKGFLSAVDLDPDGKEHLDAIDTIKRFAMNIKAIEVKKPFPSTSSITAASFVENLFVADIDPSVLQRWKNVTSIGPLSSKSIEAAKDIPYLSTLSRQPKMREKDWLLLLDGDLYFQETFTQKRLEQNYGIPEARSSEKIRDGKSALSALLQAADAQKVKGPTPYYGTLVMDGDNIGVLLNKVKDEQQHQGISRALSRFSREEALQLVEQRYPGRLVYSGGDDVFAMAPLTHPNYTDEEPPTLLILADQLQVRYQETVREAMREVLSPEELERMTASTGIAIAHHYTSLSYVVRMAREAEQVAKKRYGKNALVVTIMRRSGEQTRVGCKWRYPELDEKAQPLVLFSRFYDLFVDDSLSPKAIYTLLEEASVLVGLEDAAQTSEVKRVLLRQLSQDKLKEEMGQLAANIVALAKQMDRGDGTKSVELHADARRYGLVETLGWLLVMAFLTRKDQE